MNKEYLAELLANDATDSADMKSLVQLYFDDQFNYFINLSEEELMTLCEERGFKCQPY